MTQPNPSNHANNRYVLVSGGAGYVGSHACKALAKAGFTPVVYDNLIYGHEWAVKWGPFEHGDILDRTRLDDVLQRYNPIAIMHFAAFAYVGESVSEPSIYYRNNVVGSLTLIEAARDHHIEHIVFSSTCATYGLAEQLPITEDTPQQPINPYGASKLMVERVLEDFSAAYDMRYVALRYFNVAGADIDNEIGEAHDPEPHLIPRVLDVAAGQQPRITVFGTDYDTPDQTCIRDYIHVCDLADAHVLALQWLLDGSPSQVFNLGLGFGFSIKEVIKTVEQVTKASVPITFGPRRAGDPAALVSDPSKAREILGWKPKFTDLQSIIGTAWAWHQKHNEHLKSLEASDA